MHFFLFLTFFVSLSALIVGTLEKIAIACEGSELQIRCPDDSRINLIRANFGRFSISICNTEGQLDFSVNCVSKTAFRIMSGACADKPNCTVPATSQLFEDPCPGTNKYLEAHYKCSRSRRRPGSSRNKSPVASNAVAANGPASTFNDNPGIGLRKQVPASNSPSWNEVDGDYIGSNGLSSDSNPPAFAVNPYKENMPDPPTQHHTFTNQVDSSSGTKLIDKSAAQPLPLPNPTPTIIVPTSEPANKLPPTPTRIGLRLDNNQNPFLYGQPLESGGSSSATSSHYDDIGKPVHPTAAMLPASSGSLSSMTNDHCPPISVRRVHFNWTRVDKMAILPCPVGSNGSVVWLCSSVDNKPTWLPPGKPDFGECSSLWLSSMERRMREGTSVINLASELAAITAQSDENPTDSWLPTSLGLEEGFLPAASSSASSSIGSSAIPLFSSVQTNLYAGDLFRACGILQRLVERMEHALEYGLGSTGAQASSISGSAATGPLLGHRQVEALRELLTKVQDAASNMLHVHLRDTWHELHVQDRGLALQMLQSAIQHNVLLFSRTRNTPSDFARSQPNLCKSHFLIDVKRLIQRLQKFK